MTIFLRDKKPIGYLVSRVSYWENVHWPRLLAGMLGKPFVITFGVSLVLTLLFRIRDWELLAGTLLIIHIITQWCYCITILGHAWFATNRLYFLDGTLTLKSLGVKYRIDSSTLHLSPGSLNNDVHMRYARPIPCVLLTTNYYGEQARFAIQIDHHLGPQALSDRASAYVIPWCCSSVVFVFTMLAMLYVYSFVANQFNDRAAVFAIAFLSISLARLIWFHLLRRSQLLQINDLEKASESVVDFLMNRKGGFKPLIVIIFSIVYSLNQPIICLLLVSTFVTSIYLFHLSKQVVLAESKRIQQVANQRDLQAKKLTKQIASKLLANLPLASVS